MWNARLFTPLLLLGLCSFLLTSFGCVQEAGWSTVERMIASDHPDVRHLSTDSLAKWLETESVPPPVLLDVREREEFAVSHLHGAHRVAPDSDLGPLLAQFPRDTSIVTYCSVGYRSAAMAERLQEAGFTNVTNLEGSIFRWANESRPLYRKGRRVRAVHPYDRLWGQLLDDELHAYTPEH